MKIYRYLDFILENSNSLFPFVYSTDFKDKVSLIESPISDDLLSMIGKELPYSMVNLGKTGDTVTFIPAIRLQKIFSLFIQKLGLKKFITSVIKLRSDHEYWSNGSSEIKVGRFVKKIFGNKYTDSQIEEFVNKWKSIEDGYIFELWDGYRIKEGYKSTNYHFAENGSNPLMNSCMNDMDVIQFYQYCNGLRLLVLLDEQDYILGRALVWKDYMGRYIMDRVYYVYDKDYYKFIDYANKNGWYYKKKNISGDSSFIYKGQEVSLRTKVKVPDVFKFAEDGFPYMDTFYYAQGEWAMNYEPEGNYFKLIDVEGGYEVHSNLDL
jgi:hypothetical protein